MQDKGGSTQSITVNLTVNEDATKLVDTVAGTTYDFSTKSAKETAVAVADALERNDTIKTNFKVSADNTGVNTFDARSKCSMHIK